MLRQNKALWDPHEPLDMPRRLDCQSQGVLIPSSNRTVSRLPPAKARESQRLCGDGAVKTQQRQIAADARNSAIFVC